MASSPKVLFGFHAVGVRLKTTPASVIEVFFDPSRRDARMRQFQERAKEAKVKLVEADGMRLAQLAGNHGHQGVVARVHAIDIAKSLDECLEALPEDEPALILVLAGNHGHQGVVARVHAIDIAKSLDECLEALPEDEPALILVLDGITDPHNLGACLRVADGAGVHAVIAPKDHAVGINATVAKVASGAAETVPYFMVTNLARTLNELKERNIWITGTSDDADKTLYDVDLKISTAWVLGAEGSGLRQLTRKTCDQLVRIPMAGGVESLNVSVASGICLYETVRQRIG